MQELQNEVISLVDELKMLSIRNDDMMAEKDVDMTTIQQLDDEAREYRRKWEATKTELRNLKGKSGIPGYNTFSADDTLSITQQPPPCSSLNQSRMITFPPLQMATLPTSTSQISSPPLTLC